MSDDFEDFHDSEEKATRKVPKTFPAPDYADLAQYNPFPGIRPGQEQILKQLEQFLQDPKIKTIILEAPTGVGKSMFAMAAARASKGAYVTTANKLLQDQYQRDFASFLTDLKGRANYECRRYKQPNGFPYNCGNSPCRKTLTEQKECSKRKECEYHEALQAAGNSSLTAFNFAAYLAFLDHVKTLFGKRNMLIADEGHSLANWLTNFVEVRFSRNSLLSLGLAPDLPDFESVDFYQNFIEQVHAEINRQLGSDDERENMDPNFLYDLETMSHKIFVFKKLLEAPDGSNNFVLYKEYDKKMTHLLSSVAFKPVVVNKIANDYMFRYADKTLILSATILDFTTFCSMMGLEHEETAIIRVGSPFPKENRPFYLGMAGPALNMSNLDQNMPQLVQKIEQIMDHYPNYKGIIHGNSYKICNYIAENIKSKYVQRLIYPRASKEQKDMLKMHANSTQPTVLLSPSMEEGVDLKDDLARFSILCKVPYPYLGDPIMRRRMDVYPGYYEWETALTIVQAYGRGVRHEADWCHTYGLDGGFVNFIGRAKHILPSWFLEAVQ
jgi:Rad3-related DNA helicase